MKILSCLRKMLMTTSATLLLLASPLSVAAENTALEQQKQPFTESVFRAAQEDNKIILVDVWAEWCPTCARQQDRLNDYFAANPDSEILVLEVDYDTQKEWVSYFKAPRQSTFILFHGEEQLWFSVAETRQEPINTELQKAEARLSSE